MKRKSSKNSPHYEMDASGMGAVAGLALLVTGVIGVGLYRRRSSSQDQLACRQVEASVYRGFQYRIDKCPVPSSPGFLAILPVQQVGTVSIAKDEGTLLGTIDDARKHLMALIDTKLGPAMTAVFVGSTR